MAQHDYDIANQTFPSFRSDLNSVLEAINTSNSGTSRPTSAVAGTIWLDTTSATTPTLKFYDGADDISLATLDYSANTVNWIDSTVVFDIVNDTTPQLGGNLDVNGNSLVSTSNGDITFTPDGTGKVVISGLNYPTSDGTADQVLKTDGSGNLSFADISGGTTWQSSIKTANFTAVSGEGYFVNTTSGAITVTLPSSPSVGDLIAIKDYASTFDTNNVTLARNSSNIGGLAEDVNLVTEGLAVTLVYADTTQGWLVTNDGLESSVLKPYSIDFLVIAGGGGGGGGYHGGGGGAGGYRTSTQSSFPGTVITVTVGNGGAGGSLVGSSGSDSSISGSGLTTITSAGGGGGGTFGNPAGNGGSGGGAGGNSTAGSGNTPSTSPSQGNNGGTANYSAPHYPNGGGGGAGAVGGNFSGSIAGSGGNGTASSITGSSVTRAGGGGGSVFSGGTAGAGGTGGGGAGSVANNSGTAGTANTGGGGGGSSHTGGTGVGASGGKGVVILSVPTADYTGTTTGSPTVTTSGSNTIMQFNGSGSYTA